LAAEPCGRRQKTERMEEEAVGASRLTGAWYTIHQRRILDSSILCRCFWLRRWVSSGQWAGGAFHVAVSSFLLKGPRDGVSLKGQVASVCRLLGSSVAHQRLMADIDFIVRHKPT
jgi:hypothetical protein